MVVQVGRDFRRSLIQLPVPSRVSYEVAQGLIIHVLENLRGQRLHNVLEQLVPLPDSSQ